MQINHRIMSWVFAIAVGLSISFCSYTRITDPEPAERRALEERVVMAVRDVVTGYVGTDAVAEFVDPVAPKRAVGKTYIFPAAGGWEVSGYYRRSDTLGWHPYLARLDADAGLQSLSVSGSDPVLAARAAADPRLVVGAPADGPASGSASPNQ